MHLGDFDTSAVIYGKFTTYRPSTGASFTLGGTPALSVYKDNSTTQSTTGVTLTVDFDAVTGFHHFAIDTSTDGTFYAAGSFFDIVITTGTVDSVSVTGTVVGGFTLRKNSALKSTTAGRTLDVSAGGEAGLDWANVGSPTTAQNLSATTIATTQQVDVNTIKTNAVVNGGTVTFPTNATLASTTNITAGTITTVTTTTTATNVTTVNGLAANVITAAATAADFGAEIATAILTDTTASNYTTANSAGKFIKDGAAWVTGTGTAQAGTSTTITLAAGASATNAHDPGAIIITGGTGAGQAREIYDYNTSTKVATVSRNWKTTPDSTSVYAMIGFATLIHSNEGVAQAGGTNTITLNATAPSVNNSLNGQTIWISAGAGQDQAGVISSYDGTTKVATMVGNWTTAPDNTSIYSCLPFGQARVLENDDKTGYALSTAGVDAVADQVWEEQISTHSGTVGSTAEKLAAAGSAGDPWSTALPGAYGAGTAGRILGRVPDIAAGAAGGIFIAGSNAATTVNITGSVTGNLSGSVGSVTGAVGSVTSGVTVTTNNDKTGYALTSAEENAIADALLARNVAGGSSSGRLVKEALYTLRNKTIIAAGTLSVYGTDDTTVSFTAAVVTTAGDPISSIDPA